MGETRGDGSLWFLTLQVWITLCPLRDGDGCCCRSGGFTGQESQLGLPTFGEEASSSSPGEQYLMSSSPTWSRNMKPGLIYKNNVSAYLLVSLAPMEREEVYSQTHLVHQHGIGVHLVFAVYHGRQSGSCSPSRGRGLAVPHRLTFLYRGGT